MGVHILISDWGEFSHSLYILSLGYDSLMVRVCTFIHSFKKQKKKKIQKRKKERKCIDMFIYDILFIWALISLFEDHLLGIFIIEGSCEISMRVFASCFLRFLCIWSVQISCESSLRSFFFWIMVEMYYGWER